MKLKLIALIALISMLFVGSAWAELPSISNYSHDPTGGTYATTETITVDVGLAGTSDATYAANYATNNRWYWINASDKVVERIDSCEGDTSCSFYPNSTGTGQPHRVVFIFPCTGHAQASPPAVGALYSSGADYWGSCVYLSTLGGAIQGTWTFTNYTAPAIPVNVTFVVTESGNFTHKLSGVNVASSSGTSGLTDINGSVTLSISPPASTYTYLATKAGYADASGNIDSTGVSGGTIFLSMAAGASSTTVRTYVRAVDGTSGAWISGANVAIKNDQTGIWTNATNTIDGSHYIDIFSNQTLSGFVTGTGYSGGSLVNQPAWDGVYEIPMYATGTLLTPGTGEVSVVVEVKDQITKAKIIGAHVDYTKSTGATEGYSTGSSGTANFLAPNVSTINVKVSKDGYTSVSKAITTTAFGPDYVLVYLPRVQAVPTDTYGNPIPTATIAGDNNHDGVVDEKDSVPGVTPITTLDTRTNTQKDTDLMNILRNNAESILWLCILAIIFGLLKMIVKW